jgi:hypothetical protein
MPINRGQARMSSSAPRLPLAECDDRQQRPGNLRPFIIPDRLLLTGWRPSDDAANLAGPGGFHELERGLKQFEILFVPGRLGAVDLYPFPRAGHTAGLKRDDVAP